MVAWCNT